MARRPQPCSGAGRAEAVDPVFYLPEPRGLQPLRRPKRDEEVAVVSVDVVPLYQQTLIARLDRRVGHARRKVGSRRQRPVSCTKPKPSIRFRSLDLRAVARGSLSRSAGEYS